MLPFTFSTGAVVVGASSVVVVFVPSEQENKKTKSKAIDTFFMIPIFVL
jgi:hypothetical protein